MSVGHGHEHCSDHPVFLSAPPWPAPYFAAARCGGEGPLLVSLPTVRLSLYYRRGVGLICSCLLITSRNVLASGGGTADRTLRIWNTVTGEALKAIDTGSQVKAGSYPCGGYTYFIVILWLSRRCARCSGRTAVRSSCPPTASRTTNCVSGRTPR